MKDDPYSPESFKKRSDANPAYHETPQDIHDLVGRVVVDPNHPQRETGPRHDRRLDFYEAPGAFEEAQNPTSRVCGGGPGSHCRISGTSRAPVRPPESTTEPSKAAIERWLTATAD
ncbi:hypothetical protein MOV08_28945 [Streptomyces yunnanensis]|uniref:Uncharacterized protein n=1 Tax=Streptomyces yunnanensis TaxID=156453 RepID=A0ABY8AM51_9ACTN|nr:hypothetical protein [Streptomyces yunnanensis]WEB46133.1 hypothetical protein MOV08_28945 [Streptomyces yunnanensis]